MLGVLGGGGIRARCLDGSARCCLDRLDCGGLEWPSSKYIDRPFLVDTGSTSISSSASGSSSLASELGIGSLDRKIGNGIGDTSLIHASCSAAIRRGTGFATTYPSRSVPSGRHFLQGLVFSTGPAGSRGSLARGCATGRGSSMLASATEKGEADSRRRTSSGPCLAIGALVSTSRATCSNSSESRATALVTSRPRARRASALSGLSVAKMRLQAGQLQRGHPAGRFVRCRNRRSSSGSDSMLISRPVTCRIHAMNR